MSTWLLSCDGFGEQAQLATIRKAMQLSTEGQHNITAAYEASSLWFSILGEEDQRQPAVVQPEITVICKALHASTLTRIGKDEDAVLVYDSILSMEDERTTLNFESLLDVRVGRAKAMQRLMRYNDAQKEYLAASHLISSSKVNAKGFERFQRKLDEYTYNAALCALRLKDIFGAEKILMKRYTSSRNGVSSDVEGSLGIIRMEIEKKYGEMKLTKESEDPMQMIYNASLSSEANPLFSWIYETRRIFSSKPPNQYSSEVSFDMFEIDATFKKNIFLRVASINNSPFDDPKLINLDDKVFLHKLLTQNNASNFPFWPIGFVLPSESNRFIDFITKNSREEISDKGNYWVKKSRAGYGSHGNSLVTSSDIQNMISSDDISMTGDEALYQKLVMPPFLIDGRKFSMRVFVLSINDAANGGLTSYLSDIGLVKFASAKYTAASINDDDSLMTNSGRTENGDVDQEDFEMLRRKLDHEFGHGIYNNLWDSIETSVRDVINEFKQFDKGEDSYVPFSDFNIPKILGFDFILNSTCSPFLLEVNRFPGLEARGEKDNYVKKRVIEEAWRVAMLHSSGLSEQQPMYFKKIKGITE
jgi:hypothetical protein